MHKWYNIPKKRIEITTRIFIDDLNKVLTKFAFQKTQFGEPTETQKDLDIFKNYMSEKIIININNKRKILIYKSKENVGDQLICYFVISDVPKIKSFEIENKALFEIDASQQNIINTHINIKKQSLILTSNNQKSLLKF